MQLKKSKKHSYKRKNNFILIEVIIALSIITMLLVPLITNPIFFCRKQLNSLEKLEHERIADLTYLDIKEQLLDKNIKENTFLSSDKDETYKSFPSYKIDFSNKKKSIKRSYKIYIKKQKESVDGNIYKFLNIDIKIGDPKYLFKKNKLKTKENLYTYQMVYKN